MSESSNEQDGLSVSPSLLDILSLLCLMDVTICKRVSRRFNDVIQGNSKRLPQKSITLHIHTKRKENTEEIVYVYVVAYYKVYCPPIFESSITERRIRLMECAVISMNDHYTTKRARMCWKGAIPVDYPDDEVIDQFVMDNRRVSVDVPIASIKEELRFVLQSLVRHFSIESFKLDYHGSVRPQWNTPDELRDVVVDTIRERRLSRRLPDPSAVIQVSRLWPRLGELCQLIDCCDLKIFANRFPLERQLFYMLGWKHQTQINLYHNQGRLNVVSFITAWAAGSCRIQALYLTPWGQEDGVELDRMVQMLRQDLSRSQISVELARAPQANPELEDPYAFIYINRPADDTVLYMAYSVIRSDHLLLYDHVPERGTSLLFDFDRINFDF